MIKTIAKLAKQDSIEVNDFVMSENWIIKNEGKELRLSLTESQLEQLEQLDLSDNSRLELVRDWFLLSAWTSLRISDFLKLDLSNIINRDGRQFINKHTKKTKTQVQIPLMPKAIKLLEKYDYKSPTISDQRFNDYIKEVAELAELDDTVLYLKYTNGKGSETSAPLHKLIAAHFARRSYATINYDKGLPISLLMAVLGHSDEHTFMKYINRKTEENSDKLYELMMSDSNKSAQAKMKVV